MADDVCIVLRYFECFFRSLWKEHRWFHSFGLAHIYTSSLVISQAQHRWSLLFARRFALLPQQTEDELAISEAQNLLTLHDIISPYISQILVASGAFQTRQSVEVSATRCWVGDLVQEHDQSSRVMHLSMSGSQKLWNLVMDMSGVWAFDYREMELSFEWSEFLSFVGFPYILTLALSGPNSHQFFLFRSLWII